MPVLGEFVCANREKSNVVGWQPTLMMSPANHICFLLVHPKKIAEWKTGFRPCSFAYQSQCRTSQICHIFTSFIELKCYGIVFRNLQ
jgi:hypothetical protein